MTTLAEADAAVAVMLEARDDAIFELLYNDGDIDDLRDADQAFSFAIEIWGRLDDEKTKKEQADAVEGSTETERRLSETSTTKSRSRSGD